MQIKPVFLSSDSKIQFFQEKYTLDSDRILSGRYVFELSECSSIQKRQLKNLAVLNSSILEIHENSAYDTIILMLCKKIKDIQITASIEDIDQELNYFFRQVYNFFSFSHKPIWKFNGKQLDFNKLPFIMGILNVTPDSFSDGGKFNETGSAVEHALAMVEQGADVIDIGGESTRPGSDAVSVEEELNRVIPVIEAIRKHSTVPVSVDTYKSRVADEALLAGADIVNDISACMFDADMPSVVQKHDAPLIIMHIKGTPKNMQLNPRYDDVCGEVYRFLSDRCRILENSGIVNVAVDPGIGFGKRLQDNLALLDNLESFKFIRKPILVGVSRKSFIGKILNRQAGQRLSGSLAAGIVSIMKGADILRVHDVGETKDALKVLEMIRFGGQINDVEDKAEPALKDQ